MSPLRLTIDDVSAWLIKTRVAPDALVPHWPAGTRATLTRCLRRSYRVDLMRPGQRCVLWLSGIADPGVHALGTLAGLPEILDGRLGERTVEVPVNLVRLAEPVPRQEWLGDPVLARTEVVRMPAGSNPSYVGQEAWERLTGLLAAGDVSGFV